MTDPTAGERTLRESVEALLDTSSQLAAMRPVGDHGDTRWGEGYRRAHEQMETELRELLASHPAPTSDEPDARSTVPDGDGVCDAASRDTHGDVGALAKALLTRHPDGYSSPLQSDYARRLVAEMLLASGWLDAVRRKAASDALTEAADDWNQRPHMGIPPGGVARWLRHRAVRIGGGS